MILKTKAAEEYLKEPYARLLIPEDKGGYAAEILEFPGCVSDGETADEAVENLENAALAWIGSVQKQGKDVPPPRGDYDYSGRIVVRLPASLHRQASLLAERDRTSLNQFLVSSIAASVGAADMFNRLKDQLKQLTFRLQTTLTIHEYNQPQQVADTGTTAGHITIPSSGFPAFSGTPSGMSSALVSIKGLQNG